MTKKEKLEKMYGEKVEWFGKKCILGLPISFTTYILTSEKLITRVGFLNLKEDEVELYRVIDKKVEFPLGQRIFGCGTITLTSTDKDTAIKVLKSIKDTRAVKRQIDALVTSQRDKYNVRGRDMMGAYMNNAELDDIEETEG